jgi:hypothetical protein
MGQIGYRIAAMSTHLISLHDVQAKRRFALASKQLNKAKTKDKGSEAMDG